MNQRVHVQVFRTTGEKRVRLVASPSSTLGGDEYRVEVDTGGSTACWVELCVAPNFLEAKRIGSIIVSAIAGEVAAQRKAAKAAYERKAKHGR